MSMTRAEYESLASAIVEADVPEEHKKTLALEIADAMCATNDRFDPKRFLQQCEINLSTQEVATYSHRLFLRSQTGVGEGRKYAAQKGR